MGNLHLDHIGYYWGSVYSQSHKERLYYSGYIQHMDDYIPYTLYLRLDLHGVEEDGHTQFEPEVAEGKHI